MAAVIQTTAKPMLGGTAVVAGTGAVWTITVSGSWSVGDQFSIVLTNSITGEAISLGAGTVTGKIPTFLLTFNKKLNLLYSTTWAFSAVNQPTVLNDLNALGNGSVELADAYSEADITQAMVPYQGRIAIFGKNHIQIWQIDADPANYQLVQVLENIGTIAKLSAKAIGELDIFFLHRTGVRSLRVRDSSLNATLIDVGSPIDSLIQSQLLLASATQQAAACSIIEPTTGQYWMFLYDTIYVLSYFPSAKITAWSQWDPTYQATDVMRVKQDSPGSFYFKLGLTSDPTQSFYTTATVPQSTYVDILPCKYLFIYSSLDALLGTITITGGLSFRGTLDLNGTTPTYTSNQLAITPQKFVTYNGQVFISTASEFLVYGGASRDTYDNVICAMETSWLDKSSPATEAQLQGVDVAQSGTWNHYGSTDYLSGLFQLLLSEQTVATFDGGKIPFSSLGTHFKHRAQTTGVAAKAVLSNLLFHYELTDQK